MAPPDAVSYAEYLARELASDTKHEYVRGEILAMSGGTIRHGGITAAFISELRTALAGRPCRVFSSDVRVRSAATGFAAYPDLTVVCTRLQVADDDPHGIGNPIVVVEVLSDGTEAYDRGAKAAHYRQIPSLREYVLVSQHEPHVEVYRRNAEDRWELYEWFAGGRLALASLGVELDVDALYADPLADG
ncbi:MAG: Uma2 family endonuclease [Myxococcota bacterium]